MQFIVLQKCLACSSLLLRGIATVAAVEPSLLELSRGIRVNPVNLCGTLMSLDIYIESSPLVLF